jgi:Cell Wall Hydrolase
VLDLEKTTSTEVAAWLHRDALDPQIHGVADTILNRLAEEKREGSISAVVNARWQFSAINSSLPGAYGSVEKMPAKAINKKVAKEVVRWLRLRAAGTPSSVGDNVNYLNPYYSSKNSLESWGWDVVSQANATGMVFGAGRAVHFHGTARNNHRPAPFAISLPEDMSDMLSPANDAGSKAGGGPKTPRKAAEQSAIRAEVSGSSNGWSIVQNLLGFLFR